MLSRTESSYGGGINGMQSFTLGGIYQETCAWSQVIDYRKLNPIPDSTPVQWLWINYTRLPVITRNAEERLGSGRWESMDGSPWVHVGHRETISRSKPVVHMMIKRPIDCKARPYWETIGLYLYWLPTYRVQNTGFVLVRTTGICPGR